MLRNLTYPNLFRRQRRNVVFPGVGVSRRRRRSSDASDERRDVGQPEPLRVARQPELVGQRQAGVVQPEDGRLFAELGFGDKLVQLRLGVHQRDHLLLGHDCPNQGCLKIESPLVKCHYRVSALVG